MKPSRLITLLALLFCFGNSYAEEPRYTEEQLLRAVTADDFGMVLDYTATRLIPYRGNKNGTPDQRMREGRFQCPSATRLSLVSPVSFKVKSVFRKEEFGWAFPA